MNTASPYEYYGPKLCVKSDFLYTNLVTRSNYDNLVKRGKFHVLRPGRGKDNCALIDLDSIQRYRPEIHAQIVQMYPPTEQAYNIFMDLVENDNKALEFFSTHRKPDGRGLQPAKQSLYYNNAIILNACLRFENQHISRRKLTWIWTQLAEALAQYDEHENNLPTFWRNLKAKAYDYKQNGYYSLLHGNEGNQNSLLRTEALDYLILSIHTMPNKPWQSETYDLYVQFMEGKLEVVNMNTGELYESSEFQTKGKKSIVSEATVRNIVNDPKYKAVVYAKRNDHSDYTRNFRPHAHRMAPMYSLSKISMDDRDIPHKMHNGKNVKAYYAFDVASQAVIGVSYSELKNDALFMECMRNMFQTLHTNNCGVPLEVEVEHHLVNQHRDTFMKAGNLFKHVRWCNPGNSQEKRAEHFIGKKKLGFEKKNQPNIGRFYAKREGYRSKTTKVFDEHNDTFKTKTFSFEEIVEMDMQTIQEMNASMHPNKKLYPGKTCWEVFIENQNPDAKQLHSVEWSKYIGVKRETSVRRSQYLRVNYEQYALPSPEVIQMLKTNNLEVDAYFVPDENGSADYVDIYQDDQYIARCFKMAKFQESTAEQTDDDKEIFIEQQKFIAQFDADIKAKKRNIGKLQISPKTDWEAFDNAGASTTLSDRTKLDVERSRNDQFESEEDEFDRLSNEDVSHYTQFGKDKLYSI
jgi:hypothetical protein